MRWPQPLITSLVCGLTLAGAAAPAAAGTYKLLYSFQGGAGGADPTGALLEVNGTLYGTTSMGGYPNVGTLFSLDLANGAETDIHVFPGGPDGATPVGSLVAIGEKLYGVTRSGGLSNACTVEGGCGTAFSLNIKTGAVKVLYHFQDGADGAYPLAGLINVGGTLYGTTLVGGSTSQCSGCGTVFALNPATRAETVLYAFQGGNDGSMPAAALIDVDGVLYGTTSGGGGSTACYNDCGTVFSLNPKTGTEKILYRFQGGNDGAEPVAALLNVNGTLYGTTLAGGTAGKGTVFAWNLATGTETVIQSLSEQKGASPYAGLVRMGPELYGTTQDGHCHVVYCGVLYSVKIKSDAEKVALAFRSTNSGSPDGGLIDVGGTLYGTTYDGGACSYGCGTIYSFTP